MGGGSDSYQAPLQNAPTSLQLQSERRPALKNRHLSSGTDAYFSKRLIWELSQPSCD